jgi:hypothetical protein
MSICVMTRNIIVARTQLTLIAIPTVVLVVVVVAASSLAANTYKITGGYPIRDEESNKKVFLCNICLWTFETETMLDIHNYLEHLIMKNVQKL